MPNLKMDVLNSLMLKKQFAEAELFRLAGQEGNAVVYKERVNGMEAQLQTIAVINAEIGLFNQYFPDQQPAAENIPAPEQRVQTEGQVHQGQTHGE